jgi:hypothetical protein
MKHPAQRHSNVTALIVGAVALAFAIESPAEMPEIPMSPAAKAELKKLGQLSYGETTYGRFLSRGRTTLHIKPRNYLKPRN